MKIHTVGAELFRADGQTDMTKLMSLFAILRPRLIIEQVGFTSSDIAQIVRIFDPSLEFAETFDVRGQTRQ
jgi:hypothetical protein